LLSATQVTIAREVMILPGVPIAALQAMLCGEGAAQLGGDLVIVEALDGDDVRAVQGYGEG
jgi:hypothetical protein